MPLKQIKMQICPFLAENSYHSRLELLWRRKPRKHHKFFNICIMITAKIKMIDVIWMMKTMTEIMITATCIYDNRPEYDDTPFLYDDTPQERKDNRNWHYDNRNRHNDNLNPNDDNHNVNNDNHHMYHENHDRYYDVGNISARSEINGPNRHDDSHDMNDDNHDKDYDSQNSNNENHLLYYDNRDEYDTPFFVWWYAKLYMMKTVTCIMITAALRMITTIWMMITITCIMITGFEW